MDEIKFRQKARREYLEWFVDTYQKPWWIAWITPYPAQAAVNASKAELKAMDFHKLDN